MSIYKRDYKICKDGPTTYFLRWPVEPLFQAAGTDKFLELAMLTGFSARTVHRWIHNGIPDRNADMAAVALGLHPMTIWPNYCDELEKAA
jgi:lambda repressor-like predicted transcriptional regulator